MQMRTFISLKFNYLWVAVAALLFSGSQGSQACSPGIQLIGTKSGQVATASITTQEGIAYISGVVYRRAHWSGPQVHIVLVNSKGQAFVAKSTTLSGWHGKPATNQRGSYVASFEPSDLARTATVQITFLGGLHSSCDAVTKLSDS